MDEGLSHLQLPESLLATNEQVFGLVNRDAPVLASVSEAPSATQPTASDVNALGFTSDVLPDRQRLIRTSRSLEISHASPLAPLRTRDSQALDDLFDVDNLQEMTLDVHRYLARTYPEPCWEDEPYDFLNGYI